MLVPPTATPVFIGYRRAETGHAADRLKTALLAQRHEVWMDLDRIGGGDAYRAKITNALRQCEVALILIGPQWATIAGPDGTRRIDDPDDDVRLEVRQALERPDILLVPVLVDGARMPARKELPEDVREVCERSGAPLTRDLWDHCVTDLHETIARSARRGWRAWGEALLIAAAVAVPAAVIAATSGLRTSTATETAGANVARLALQRAEIWALIMAAVLGWVAFRRPGHRWAPALRAGLLWGALFGLLGALVHAVPTYVIDRETWLDWGVTPEQLRSIRIAAYALGVGVTGAGVGALVGAAWNPPGIGRGILAGLVTGGLLGWLVRTNIGGEDTQTKILTSILVAVGIVGATVATEWLTRAATTRRPRE